MKALEQVQHFGKQPSVSPPSLRRWLLLLLLVSQGAIFGSAIALMLRAWSLHQLGIKIELQRTVSTLAASISRSLDERALQLVALHQNLPPGSIAATAELRTRASLLIQFAPQWSSIALQTSDGSQVWNTSSEASTPNVEAIAREHEARALQTGRPVVSDVFQNRHGLGHLIAIAIPVKAEEQVYVMTGTLNVTMLSKWFDGAKMTENSVGGVLDRNFRFVTRTTQADRFIGSAPSDDWRRAIENEPHHGVARLITLEGVASYCAWARIQDTGWTVGIAVPAEPLERVINDALAQFAALALSIVTAGAAVAWWIARRLLHDVRSLGDAAKNLGDIQTRVGCLSLNTNYHFSELTHVGLALASADARLHTQAEQVHAAVAVTQEALQLAQDRLLELHTARESLLKRQFELQTIAEHSPDVIVRFGRDLRHLYVNSAIEGITGRRPNEIVGQTNRELGMDVQLCDRWDRMLNLLFETGQPQRIEFQFADCAGVNRHFLGRFVPEFSSSQKGFVESVLGVVHDRTADVEMQRLLSSESRRKSEFIATLAHEIRNPLAAVTNGLKFLELVELKSERATKTLLLMDRQLKAMARLTNDMLEASCATLGKLTIASERVRLQDVVADVLLGINCPTHELKVKLSDRPVFVSGDSARLNQVLANLVTNAIKYSPDGGVIEITLEQNGAVARLIVRDEGLGVPPDKLSEIFSPFSQVAAHSGYSRGGLGIGLAVSAEIVRLHHGKIVARSDGIRGTEVEVELPLNS